MGAWGSAEGRRFRELGERTVMLQKAMGIQKSLEVEVLMNSFSVYQSICVDVYYCKFLL